MKFKRIMKSNLLISSLIAFISFLVILMISGFRIVYSTNDDYFISLFIANGEEKNIFISYFLSLPLVALQKLIPAINFYMLSQLCFCIASVVVINFIWLERFERKYGVIASLLFTVLYLITSTVCLQWTHTSVITCVAGLLLLLNTQFENQRRRKIVQMICASILVVVSSFYRFVSVKVVFVYFAIFICTKVVIMYLKNRSVLFSKKSNIKSVINRYWKLVVIITVLWVVVFSLENISQHIKQNSQEYVSFSQYNSVRSGSVDYYRPPYEENKEFYNSLNIYSQNDLDMLGTWHGDEDFFTTEKLTSIRDYIRLPQFQSVFSINYLYNLISNKIETIIGLSAPIVLIVSSLLMLLVLILLFIFRNKLKILFPIILTIIWFAFFLVFRITEVNVLAIPLAFMIVVFSFFYNRYSYIMNFLLTFCFMGLYCYLNFSRISFRTSYNIILPVFALVIFNLNKKDIRCKFKNIAVSKKNISLLICSMILLCLSVFSSVNVYFNEVNSHLFFVDSNLLSQIKGNKNVAYVCDLNSSTDVLGNYSKPLMPPIIEENIIPFMGWVVGSPYYHSRLQMNDIDKLFSDMINSDRIKLVLNDDEIKEMYEQYYNGHYSNGKKIILIKENVVDSFSLYKVVQH